MTGFRLGWIVAPPALIEQIAKLIEYNTSCAPGFVQKAGLVAVRDGEAVVARTQARLRRARDHLVAGLRQLPGIEVAVPGGAMYAFFRVEGMHDSLSFCRRLVTEAGLGLAPGIAFGPEGEGFIRWCFAAETARLDAGLERLARGLALPAAA
jgi:aspartate/methionine/tyrosine aminotransferase